MNFCGEMYLRPSIPNFNVCPALIQVKFSTAVYRFWTEYCGPFGSGPTLMLFNSSIVTLGNASSPGKVASGTDVVRPVRLYPTRSSLVTDGEKVWYSLRVTRWNGCFKAW